ncbi:MAG TPA: hypothetical protein VG410_05055 [Solirubrobacteraceae bacterium]|jgi:hypothetical protein|nr:hypothetical protein [Solirubrobacteraceae bacterium]
MKRLLTAALLGIVVLVPVAHASDTSLEKALKAYKHKLTTDIAYLSSFAAPSKSATASVSKKLSTIRADLKGAQSAAQNNQASSASGRKGRSEVLTGLGYALVAEGDAKAAASAAASGKKATAKSDAKKARAEIANKAIAPLESGGMALGLF